MTEPRSPKTAASLPWLKAEVVRKQDALERLSKFEAAWNAYAGLLRQIATARAGEGPHQIPPELRPLLIRAEAARVEVVNLGPVYLGAEVNRTEFTYLTEANLRTAPEKLLQQITEDHPTLGAIQVITENALEAKLGEAAGIIRRKREHVLAEMLQTQAYVNIKEDEEKKRRGSPEMEVVRLRWGQIRNSSVGKVFWWVFGKNVKWVVRAGALAGAIYLVHRFAPGVERTVRGLLSPVSADSSHAPPR